MTARWSGMALSSAGDFRLSCRIFRLSSALAITMSAAYGNEAAARNSVPAEPSIVEVQRGLAAGRFDVRALERHYKTRINTIDHAGPRLNSARSAAITATR